MSGLHDAPPSRTTHLVDSRIASEFVRVDPEWRAKIGSGGYCVFIPIIGFAIALGYRKVLAENLHAGASPVLPSWRMWRSFALAGVRSIGIMFGYYAPLYAVALVLVLARDPHAVPWAAIALVVALVPFTLPLTLQVILVTQLLFAKGAPPVPLPACVGLGAGFAVLTFIIPSAYLQVSKTGRYLSAFDLPAVIALIARNFRPYLRAWFYSGMVSLRGHAFVFLRPWGIFWAYQSILYSFNEVVYFERLRAGDPSASAFPSSWFGRLRNETDLALGHARAVRFMGMELPRMDLS